ncbi:hypothetical protein FQN54_006696 [Arachnomyces sp. PD_36]|nr:hypothetical protein FQN54_006696 [Arachnomyces sp. PD_36]
MRTNIPALLGLATLSTALPSKFHPGPGHPHDDPPSTQPSDFSLVGYGKENPLGETTGGEGGPTTTVSSLSALQTAVEGDEPAVVYVEGEFELEDSVSIGSNKSLIGAGKGAKFSGGGLSISGVENVVVRNVKIEFVEGGDAIAISDSRRVWIDHNEFESDLDGGPDFYDGQLDITDASDWITVSWNHFHDHWKSSLVGNSDTNHDVDFGHLHITYHHNFWQHEGTRGPAGRFGHQHIYNNLYEDFLYQAIHSRSDNQVLVEGNVFRGNTSEALSTYGLVIPEDSPNTSPDGDYEIDGFANLGAENDWGTAGVNITQEGDFTSVEYNYTLTPLKLVEDYVRGGVGLGKILLE